MLDFCIILYHKIKYSNRINTIYYANYINKTSMQNYMKINKKKKNYYFTEHNKNNRTNLDIFTKHIQKLIQLISHPTHFSLKPYI